jgi:hypothetical protein
MSHPFVLGDLAVERRDTYLKEAESHRTARQAKKNQYMQTSLVKRMAARLRGLQIGLVRREADQGRIATSDTFMENKNKIPAG